MIKKRKLVVAQVLPELNYGGVEKGTLELARFLVERGHKSIIISGGGRLEKDLHNIGSHHINLSLGNKSLLTLFLIPKLIKVLRNYKVDILHARSRLPAWICYITLKFVPKKNRPIFVTTVHGYNSVSMYSSIMTKGKKIIVVTDGLSSYIKSNYKIDANKINVIYRGVNSDNYPYGYKPNLKWITLWNNEFPQTVNKIILTLPGRLTERKGHEDFIRLLSTLTKKYKNIHGLIVGDSNKKNYKTKLQNRIVSYNLSAYISFTGHRDDIKEIFAISGIVYSLSDKPEAFGRTVIESIKLGVPVIGYDHGGVGEQLAKIFKEGIIRHKDQDLLEKVSEQFIIKRPIVKKTKLFNLQNTLIKTLKLYSDIVLLRN